MKIVKNIKKVAKSYSAMSLASIGLIVAFWEGLPPEVVGLVPDEYHKWIVVGIAALGYVGRFIQQGEK